MALEEILAFCDERTVQRGKTSMLVTKAYLVDTHSVSELPVLRGGQRRSGPQDQGCPRRVAGCCEEAPRCSQVNKNKRKRAKNTRASTLA